MNVDEFLLRFALMGIVESIDAITSKLYAPSIEALREATIRVTDESHVWEFKGVVPGAYESIQKLYLSTESSENRKYLEKLNRRIESVSGTYWAHSTIGTAPQGIVGRHSDGRLVSGVLPCWTGQTKVIDREVLSKTYGMYVDTDERNLYTARLRGRGVRTTVQTRVVATRPHLSGQGDCFTCSWSPDGVERRCQEAIDYTYQAQIEACWNERELQLKRADRIASIYNVRNNPTIALAFERALNNNIQSLLPAQYIAREIRVLNTRLSDIDFALDWVQGKLSVEAKKANPDALKIATGFNIGDTYKQRDGKEKVMFSNLEVAKKRLVEDRNALALNIALKKQSLETIQS